MQSNIVNDSDILRTTDKLKRNESHEHSHLYIDMLVKIVLYCNLKN
jgi:hypothetical protein